MQHVDMSSKLGNTVWAAPSSFEQQLLPLTLQFSCRRQQSVVIFRRV
jgi:hypothetical protein